MLNGLAKSRRLMHLLAAFGMRRAAQSFARRHVLNAFRARYDAATTTDGNRRHWANADGLSADAAASPEVRRIVRNRSRYEVANNSFAKGIVLTLANDCIGTGPRLQMLLDDPEANRFVEYEFGRWAKATRLAQWLRTMRMARAVDGEAFIVLRTNPGLRVPVTLCPALVEADQITTPDLLLPDDHTVDGIVFDDWDNPVEYHVLKHHPGDPRCTDAGLDYRKVPARDVIHYYRMDRAGQSRGLPDIMPALPLFAQLRRYTLAVIAAAEAAADLAMVLYTDAPAGEPSDDVEPMDLIELEQRMATVLPSGWKLGQAKAEQPATTYVEFVTAIINEIARCLNMPLNVATCNSAKHNYASGRLDHQTYHRAILVDRGDIQDLVLDRLFDVWFAEAVLIEGYLPQSLRQRNVILPHQWFWDGFEHVDPAKEAIAQSKRLASRTTTLAAEYAKQGKDWETELRQLAKERKLMRELGLLAEQSLPAAA